MAALVLTELRVTVVCKPADTAYFRSIGAETVEAPGSVSSTARRLVWEQSTLPSLARRIGADVVHSPHYTFPLRLRIPRVVTIHDLTFFTMPQVHSRLKRTFFRWWIRAAARKGITVIAVSAATARDYETIAGGRPETVTVSLLGYDESLFHLPSDSDRASLRSAVPDLPDSWLSFLGTLEPRKNVAALIDGYTAAVAGRVSAPALLLAGGAGWDDQVQPALARASAAGTDVRSVGYLPLEALAAFLGDSTIFVYPSLGEGFGLPVLEAMATGCCVVTTRRLSLPEVGGDAVEYTDVDAGAIGRAISSLLNDSARRATLSSEARRRATTFTWSSAAQRHAQTYQRAVNHGR